jgi:hypothetical protein
MACFIPLFKYLGNKEFLGPDNFPPVFVLYLGYGFGMLSFHFQNSP